MTTLTYRPWIPRAGFGGETFRTLVAAYGNPNNYANGWPAGLLEVVCERGESVEYQYSQYGSGAIYFVNPHHPSWMVYIDAEHP